MTIVTMIGMWVAFVVYAGLVFHWLHRRTATRERRMNRAAKITITLAAAALVALALELAVRL